MVFPEDVGLMLVVQGMRERLQGVETIEEAIQRAVRAHLIPLAITKWRRKLSWVPAFYLYRHRAIAETYFEVFSQVAKEYGVYLVAGSAVLPPYRVQDGVVLWRQGPVEHRVYNTAYLFGPDGKVVGKQDKVYLIELEQEAALDLTSGDLDALRVFDTPLGRIGSRSASTPFKTTSSSASWRKAPTSWSSPRPTRAHGAWISRSTG